METLYRYTCESALHEIISSGLRKLDSKLITAFLFIIFKKAFDMVDQELLLYKLANYRFDNHSIKLMSNYFSDRSQCVKIEDEISDEVDIILGVPQGSILGPLLFDIYINDIAFYLKDILVKLFADDTTLLFSERELSQLISKIKSGIFTLNEWCKFNKLFVNWEKTFLMFVTNRRVSLPDFIEIDGQKVMSVKKFRLLGVNLDNRLNFEAHAYEQSNVINKRIYSIKRMFFLPFNLKMTFFKAFILPYFDYCISLSIYFSHNALKKFNKTYYLCLHKLFGFKFNNMNLAQVNSFLKEFNIFPYQYRVFMRTSFFLHKMCNNNSPVEIKDCFIHCKNECVRNDSYCAKYDTLWVLKRDIHRLCQFLHNECVQF